MRRDIPGGEIQLSFEGPTGGVYPRTVQIYIARNSDAAVFRLPWMDAEWLGQQLQIIVKEARDKYGRE